MQPRTLNALAYWAAAEAAEAVLEPPARLHAKHYPEGEAPEHVKESVIIGPPFTKAFGRYLDGDRPLTPIRRALRRMRSRDHIQSPEYRICHAIVEDGQPVEHVRSVLGCADHVLVRALVTLYDLTQIERSEREPLRKPVISVG